jgi:hypothetical protein
MVRSIVAVIAGFVLVFVLSVGTDGLLMALFRGQLAESGPESPSVLLLVLGYCFVYLVVGGYVAAWIAGRAEVTHGVVLGSIGLVVSVALTLPMLLGLVPVPPQQSLPAWYAVACFISAITGPTLGGYLRSVSKRPRGGDPAVAA